MKNFPFRLIFISIFLPPICYILTIQVLEGYLQKRDFSKLNQIMIQNLEALYAGRYTISEEIDRNLGEHLSRSLMYKLGVSAQILVKTKDGRILYPTQFNKDHKEHQETGHFSEPSQEALNYVEVAAENYTILNQGLTVALDVKVKHNSWLSNSILVFFVFLSAFFLKVY